MSDKRIMKNVVYMDCLKISRSFFSQYNFLLKIAKINSLDQQACILHYSEFN